MIWDSCIFLDISEPALSLILGILCSITLPPRFRLCFEGLFSALLALLLQSFNNSNADFIAREPPAPSPHQNLVLHFPGVSHP
jgi:hypothetical protein